MSSRRQRRLAALALALGLAAMLAPTRLVEPVAAALIAIANPDTLTTSHDRLATVPAPGVLSNDANLLGSTTAVFVSGTTHGTVNLAADGGYTYAPATGFTGTDQFKYRDSGLLTNTTTVTITVTNAAPVARDDAYAALTGVTLTVPTPGVLANDTDADGDSLHASLVSGGGNGSLSLSSSGSFTFTSGGSFVGVRTFTYQVSDGLESSPIATVSINVGPAPTPSPPPPTPAPTPPPTPAPTPAPTPSPTPTPAPTVTLLPTLPPLPTLLPSLLPAPSGSSPPDPVRATPSATPAPTSTGSPGASPGQGPSTDGGPGGGPIAAGPIAIDPSSPPSGRGGDAGTAAGFIVGRPDPARIEGLTGLSVDGIGGLVEWAVPALVLSVPGLLLVIAVLAQAAGALFWVPVARRWLGGFGIRRRAAYRA